jgi:head-tail adaptor
MSDAIGAMRARILLQQRTRVADEIGGAAIAWIEADAAWAEIAAIAAGSTPGFDANPAVATFRVTINRRSGVRVGWRIAWGARLLRVTGVRDDGAARIDLICEEEVI